MARIAVRLTPRGGADRIEGWGEDAEGRPILKARVRAAPVEGQANAALTALIARAAGVPKSYVMIARGGAARVKTVEIKGLADDEARRRLSGAGG